MATPFAVGIDLGTSTSEICIYRSGAEPYVVPDPSSPGRSPVVPSIVAVNRRGELTVGRDALPYINQPGAGLREVKRKMGSGKMVSLAGTPYRPEEISSLILRRLKQNAEEALGTTIRDVVVSVPANFPDAARQATMNAGALADLNIIRLINEPTAASLAFGIKHLEAEEQIVVFDYGGGTLDITVLEMIAGVIDVRSSFGDPELGGKDFDEALMRLIYQRFQEQNPGVVVKEQMRNTLKEAAEEAKITLSTQPNSSVYRANFGMRCGEPVDLDVEISRRELESTVAPLLDRARDCVRQALAAKRLRPSVINRVLLVGGTTYMPCVRQLIAELFGREPKADVNPDLAVAIGASVQAALAAKLLSERESIVLTDVSPFGLGVDVVQVVSGRPVLMYDPLIQPNTTIPYSTQRQYRLMHSEQTSVEVHLYQDHKGDARFPSDAIDTGISAEIPDIPIAEDGTPHALEVDFSYDLNGIARLTARIPRTGQRMELSFENSATRMNPEDLRESRERVQDLWRQHPKAKRYSATIAKAEQMLDNVHAEVHSRLKAAIKNLQVSLETGEDARIDAAGGALTDLLFDIENGNR
jgi:molecular chaperone DnaK